MRRGCRGTLPSPAILARPMNCPECGNENREEARFCDSCGAQLW
ncbi:MAG: zinc-ribbon domain-containing protein, partial [Thermoleophilia bacterium]|nr:zinc-ribbon domain-containing protein [Thermoleophilia bacterium]